MKLGLLDFGNLLPWKRAGDLISETIELAKLADSKGFTRYWLTEHHSESVTWAGPEIMLGLLAKATQRIKVGAAGVLLNLYSPFKVAENFKFIESIAPGRIDLGLARGTAPKLKYVALTGNEDHENYSKDFDKKVIMLLKYLNDEEKIKANPVIPHVPEVWLLGSSFTSAKFAAKLGVAYAYSGFMKGRELDSDIIKSYKENFSPSKYLSSPKANITLAGACASNEDEAKSLVSKNPNESIRVSVAGSVEVCFELLTEFAEKFHCDEIIFNDVCLNFEDRLRSIKLLSEIISTNNS